MNLEHLNFIYILKENYANLMLRKHQISSHISDTF
jgi:hypothetical protein